MTDDGLLKLFLFLHVLAAIIAFGPTFIFPLIGAMGSKEPAHGNFGVRLSERIIERVVIPFALSMPVTGLFLIWFSHVNLADRSGWWLDIAIVLYIIAVSIAIFVQLPVVRRVIQLTSGPPPGAGAGGPAAAGRPAVAGGPPAGPPAGPPPAVRAAAKEIRRNGSILGILIIVIVLLMTAKPQF